MILSTGWTTQKVGKTNENISSAFQICMLEKSWNKPIYILGCPCKSVTVVFLSWRLFRGRTQPTYTPGTLNNHFLWMFGETTSCCVGIWNHQTVTTIEQNGCLGYQIGVTTTHSPSTAWTSHFLLIFMKSEASNFFHAGRV